MPRHLSKTSGGFSLVELLVVVAIVGILTATALPAYDNYITRAKVKHGMAALQTMTTELQTYYEENGSFPTDTTKKASGQDSYGRTQVWTNSGVIAGYQPHQLVYAIVYFDGLYEGAAFAPILMQEGIPDAFGKITWACVYHQAAHAMLKAEHLPESCNRKSTYDF